MSQQLAIIKPENIAMIVDAAPQAYTDNKLSSSRCILAGQAFLDEANTKGMNEALDQQIAQYIEKARKTITKMNERRSPVTKLFDEIRTTFTTMENIIDPTKAGTIPYQLQQHRNQYAAQLRLQEEARLRAERARNTFRQEVEDFLNQNFNNILKNNIDTLTREFNNVTLDTYDKVYNLVKNIPTEFPGISAQLGREFGIPLTMPQEESAAIWEEVRYRLLPKFQEMYRSEIQDNKDYILDHLPSKKTLLESMAKANTEEANRIKAQMEEHQRQEAAKKEAERQAKAEIERNKSQIEGLFNQQATIQTYQPKTQVAKKIELLNPEGILPIISMWWSKEGCTLTTDELAKIFKRQITFCERIANKKDIFVEDESVAYIDEVKAK